MRQILLIENDAVLASMYSLKLQKAGYKVAVVDSAEAGLDHIANEHAVVVIDILLREKNGLWFLKELRRQGYTVPVIILTNLAEADFAMPKSLRETLGVAAYLVKTQTTPAELVARVHLAERR